MHIVLAFDKFKGSLTAAEACAAAARGLRRALPQARLTLQPVADGGEGTVDAVHASLGGRLHEVEVEDALGLRRFAAPLLVLDQADGRVAVIEMASASGLEKIPAERRDPLRATTFGTGQLLREALQTGAGQVLIGLGGSATNDGGVGLARAFGYRFVNARGKDLEPIPAALKGLARIVPPESGIPSLPVTALADVTNPLLGPEGATRVFGPQKGAGPEAIALLECALERLADRVAADLGVDFRSHPGAGAAGGLSFGLMSFVGARLAPGFSTLAALAGLEEAIRAADAVVTGEGRLDRQTLFGKAPAGVAGMASRHAKPVYAIGGSVEPDAEKALRAVFEGVWALSPPGEPLQTALREAAQRLETAAERLLAPCLAGRIADRPDSPGSGASGSGP